MIGDIYFSTTKGGLVTNYELAKMAYVVNAISIDADDLDAVRKYAKSCKGIRKEVNPSIKMCLKNNEDVKAIMIYRDRHPGVGLKGAKEAIEDMKAKLRLGILK